MERTQLRKITRSYWSLQVSLRRYVHRPCWVREPSAPGPTYLLYRSCAITPAFAKELLNLVPHWENRPSLVCCVCLRRPLRALGWLDMTELGEDGLKV